jgi:putative peptidoglycan lipid II flippase
VNIALGVSLFYLVGFWGIAAATSIAAWISVIQMALALSRRGVYRPSARAWFKMSRVAAASVALGVLLAVAAYFRPVLEAPFAGLTGSLGAKELVIVLLSGAGLALYPVLLFAFGGVTPAEAKALLKRRRGAPPAAPSDLL